MSFRPQTSKPVVKKEFWDTQMQKVPTISVNQEFINENLFQWKEKKIALTQALLKNVTTNHLDDSSDEDDNFEEVPKEYIKKLKKEFSIENSQISVILENEGRRIIHSQDIKDLYHQKKSVHLKSSSEQLQEYSLIVQHFIENLVNSLEAASYHFVRSMKIFIRYLLNQDDSVILQEFLSILYMNLIACINTNQYNLRKWLRSYTRLKKSEFIDLPEWLKEMINRCIWQYFQNFKSFIEQSTKRKFDDPKYQFEIVKNIVRQLIEILSREKSVTLPSKSSNSQNLYQEYLGDFIHLPHSFDQYLKKNMDSRSLDLLAKSFHEQNQNIFNFKQIEKIFYNTQQMVLKKHFSLQNFNKRVTLQKQYFNKQDIRNFEDFMSELHLIRRSVHRTCLNGSDELIHHIVFDHKNDISVQIQFTIKKSPKKINMKILSLPQDNIATIYEDLGIESSELAYVVREVVKNGFVKNPIIKGLSKQQKQYLALIIVYFYCKLSFQCPSTLITLNMMIDLVQADILKFEYLFHQIPNESQYEQWLVQQVNDISPRQHYTNQDQNIKIESDINDFFQKRYYISQTWIAMQKRQNNFPCLYYEDLLRKLLKLQDKNWFGIQG